MPILDSKYNRSQLVWAGGMFLFFLLSYHFWGALKVVILQFLQSEMTTFSIVALILIIAILHFRNNFDEKETAINSSGGPLEKPIDYLQFVGTYSTILIAAQTFSREFLIVSSFDTLDTCKSFGTFDKVSFACCVIVLITYSYVRMKPVVFEAFVRKEKVVPNLVLDQEQIANYSEADQKSKLEPK